MDNWGGAGWFHRGWCYFLRYHVTTSGTLSAHNKSIDDLTRVLKEESLARATMEKNEAAKREELRKEYLGMMKDQTATFSTIGEKLTTVGTKVEVIGTKYEAVAESVKKIDDSIRKVLEQTAPVPAAGSIPRYKR